jgi:hypothetical protein
VDERHPRREFPGLGFRCRRVDAGYCWQFVSNDSSAGRFTGTCLGRIGSKGLRFWVGRVRVQNGRIGGLGYVVSREASIPAAGYAFAEPSVTTGEVEKCGKQLTEEEAVVEYLQSEGIDTADLEGLELPPSTEVIRERLQFLLKIGLVVQDNNDYPLLLGCSVKKNLIPVLDYLDSLGVTTSSLPILVRKYPQILHSSVVVDLCSTWRGWAYSGRTWEVYLHDIRMCLGSRLKER